LVEFVSILLYFSGFSIGRNWNTLIKIDNVVKMPGTVPGADLGDLPS
jgi:hypothetical protein